MNRSQIRDRILSGLNDSTSSPVFWSTAQINTVIDEASEVLSEEAAALKRTALTVLRPGTTYYATRGIAPDLMVPVRLWLPSENRRLIATTAGQLDAFHERWETVEGTPQNWFPMAWDWFGVFPHPAEGGGILRVDYLAWQRSLFDDSDSPEFPDADHDGLVLYGIYDGLLKRWDVAQATIIFNQFLEYFGLAQAKSGTRQMQARNWTRESAPAQGVRSGVGWSV